MITHRIATLCIIISLENLRNLLVIRLVKIKWDLRLNIASVFAYKKNTINQVAMVKFFHIIYKRVLLSLFVSRYHNRNLLKLALIYFVIIKINGCNMLYLYCLFYLKEVSYLPIFCKKIWENKDFCIKLLTILEYIIKCSTNNNVFYDALYYACLDAHKVNTIEYFIIQLKKIAK